jgi:hypothetical protein
MGNRKIRISHLVGKRRNPFRKPGWLIFKSESILSIFSRVFVDLGFKPRVPFLKGISLEGKKKTFLQYDQVVAQ